MSLRHIVLFAGVVIAAWFAFFGDNSPNADIAEPVIREGSAPNPIPAGAPPLASAPQQTRTTIPLIAGERAGERGPVILELKKRETLIWDRVDAQQTETLFNIQSWVPPPPVVKPSPPMAPPLPFVYLGKKIEEGVWEVYLGRGEKTFIVRAQSIIENTYRVDSITPPTLSFTYLPLKQVQRLTIGGTE